MKTAFVSTLIASFLAATATAASVQPAARDSNEYQSFKNQVRSLPKHKRGYFHLGGDGVMRSLGPRNEVLGFAAASPEVLARHIADKENEVERRYLESVFEGVDGRDVADPWVLRRDLVAPGPAEELTARDEVLDARDIVVRDLLSKRTCATRDATCTRNSDCGNDCDCDHEHFSTKGNCKDD
ncbi:hypothetical protein F5B20DRAFT_590657 [Whalleya microplaca]|nr:hypothetical protein F5B20DRAFT_590657 [Whalleya microplaca]